MSRSGDTVEFSVPNALPSGLVYYEAKLKKDQQSSHVGEGGHGIVTRFADAQILTLHVVNTLFLPMHLRRLRFLFSATMFSVSVLCHTRTFFRLAVHILE